MHGGFSSGLSVCRTQASVPLGATVTGTSRALGPACVLSRRCTLMPPCQEMRGVGTRSQTPADQAASEPGHSVPPGRVLLCGLPHVQTAQPDCEAGTELDRCDPS